jgi:DNA helicase-2/ATP-dependent DNA helicase PcrA
VGLEDGLFPSYRAGDDKDRLEEERRLLYVAITRTMRDLNISFVKMRYLNGETARCRPSVFIAELGYDKDDCCDDFSLWF